MKESNTESSGYEDSSNEKKLAEEGVNTWLGEITESKGDVPVEEMTEEENCLREERFIDNIIDREIPKKKKDKKKRAILSIISCIAILLIIGGGFRWWMRAKISKVTTVSNEDIVKLAKDYIEETPSPDGTSSPAQLINKMNATIDANTNNGFNGILQDENVTNIMILGSDSRKTNTIGLTDVMILVSINKVSQEVYLTSFMRDSYVAIPEHDNNRLNTVFKNGADTFFKAMEENFKIKVDRFVYIDFFSFIDVVDEIGGITINVAEEERVAMNKVFAEINRYLGDPTHSGELTSAGSQTLTGKQALAWTRIRKLAGNDFKRTERQRIVLEKILTKVKSMNVFRISSLADVVLPKIMTNMTYGEIESMLLDAMTYLSYDIVQQRVPADRTYSGLKLSSGAEVLSMDFDENIKMLGKTIYKKVYDDENKTTNEKE